jgi:hypothetical protein
MRSPRRSSAIAASERTSSSGPRGGYRLAREPSDTSVEAILRSMECRPSALVGQNELIA